MPADEVDDVLATDRYADAVRADVAQAAAYGIYGVPFFVVDGKYGISGAQPAEIVLQTLEQAWSEHQPLTFVTSSAGTRARATAVSCNPVGVRLREHYYSAKIGITEDAEDVVPAPSVRASRNRP